jgi:predicted nucleotide-binding protein (sugar kinase/HSP70/actin superfamily)
MNKKISFPHLGNYYIPIKYIISNITNCEVLIPPKNTKKTIELGSKYSPDDICMPFKYNLGNYIEALEQGADILIQAGGGCRYGYYAELQEQILKELGYKFEFINLIQNNNVSLIKLYKTAKKINPKLNIFKYSYYVIQGIIMIITMDKIDKIIRKNIGFEKEKGTHEKIEKKYHQELSKRKLGILKILKIYITYKKIIQEIPLKEESRLHILLIGELYSLMDFEASNHLERNLAKKGIKITRYTDLTYLLLTKRFMRLILLYKGRKYVKYHLGADGTESIVHAIDHCKQGIDGIIHIKSFGCVPEINAMPSLSKISEDFKTPILYLSFDGENNISNIDTKIEAFKDMIKQKKISKNEI